MGYTHYWYHDQAKGAIPPETWAKITADARAIIKAAGERQIILWHEYDEPGTEPLVDDEQIFLNGAGDDGHETFLLARHGEDFQFCKTAHKPYDAVVTAILAVAAEHAGDYLRISSDGGQSALGPGLQLAAEALGRQLSWPVREGGAEAA